MSPQQAPCFPTCVPMPRPSRREPVNTCAPLPEGFLLSLKLALLLAWQAGGAGGWTLAGTALMENIQRLMWVDAEMPQQHRLPAGRAARPRFTLAPDCPLWTQRQLPAAAPALMMKLYWPSVAHPQPCPCLLQLPCKPLALESSCRTCCWETQTETVTKPNGKWNILHESGERKKDWRTSLSQTPQALCIWIRFGSTNIDRMPST